MIGRHQDQKRDGQGFRALAFPGQILGQHIGAGPERSGGDRDQRLPAKAFSSDARDDDGSDKADNGGRKARRGHPLTQEQGGAKNDEERAGGQKGHHLPDRHARGEAIDEDMDAEGRDEGPDLVGERALGPQV